MSTKQQNQLTPGVVVGIVLAVVLAMSGLAAVANTLSDPPDEFTRPQFSEAAGKGPGTAGKSAGASSATRLHQAPVKTGKVDFGNGLTAQTPSGWTHELLDDLGLDMFTENNSASTVNITFYTSDAGSFTSEDVVAAYVDDFVLTTFTDVELVGEGPNGRTPFAAPMPNRLLAEPVAIGYTAFVTSQSQGNLPVAGMVIGAIVDGDIGIAIEVVDEATAFSEDDFADQDELIASIQAG